VCDALPGTAPAAWQAPPRDPIGYAALPRYTAHAAADAPPLTRHYPLYRGSPLACDPIRTPEVTPYCDYDGVTFELVVPGPSVPGPLLPRDGRRFRKPRAQQLHERRSSRTPRSTIATHPATAPRANGSR